MKHEGMPRPNTFLGKYNPFTTSFTAYEVHVSNNDAGSKTQEFKPDVPENRPHPWYPCGSHRVKFHFDFPIVRRVIKYNSIFDIFSKIGGF